MEKDFDANDPNFRRFLSPNAIDQMIRNSLQMCWMMLPKEKQNLQEVEAQFRKIVERAIKDFRDDSQTFMK